MKRTWLSARLGVGMVAAAALLVAISGRNNNILGQEQAPKVVVSTGTGTGYIAVPLPDPKIKGFQFPETEATILKWVTNDKKAINLHGWGLWVALTTLSDQSYEGQKLRVFETWYEPGDLQSALVLGLKFQGSSRFLVGNFRPRKGQIPCFPRGKPPSPRSKKLPC